MIKCLFAADLHGKTYRYEALFRQIIEGKPVIVLLGGDLLPHGMHRSIETDFTEEYLFKKFLDLKNEMGIAFPEVLLILGNDDPRSEEKTFIELSRQGIWHYIHNEKYSYEDFTIYGYSFVPPTPFRLKDWEKYDVSRYVDPGCIPPDEGIRTTKPDADPEWATISDDLKGLVGEDDMKKALFLFHSPPHKTYLDRAALDGVMVDHVPMDVHVGSIAIMRFIEEKQPLLTMHGHIHESTRLTGHWRQQFGRTHSFNAAWDGSELSLVIFDLDHPEDARRLLI